MFHVGQWIEEQYLVIESRSDYFWAQYIVQDRISENIFVIKRFSESVLCDKSAAVRFIGKAKIWINLGEFDEIVSAYMMKEYDGVPHIFLEYVNGSSLAALLASQPGKALPLEQIVALMKQVIAGMKFLHSASLIEGTGGVIHGGLSPGTILLKEGGVKIGDIGLISALRQSRGMKNIDQLSNQFPYLAPEQIGDPARADEVTDIYSFGAVLYEVATGTAAIAPAVSDDPLHDFLVSNPVSPRVRNRSCPPWLEETILKCMAKERENRFQSFNHIEAFLTEILRTERIPRAKAEMDEEADHVSRVARVRGIAKKESRRLNHYYLGVEHLMLGLLAEEESLVVSCLGDKFSAAQLHSEVLSRLPKGEGPWYWEGIIKTPRYQRLMSRARKIRRYYGHERMLPQHVLLAILEEGRNAPFRVLKELSIDVKAAAECLRRELRQNTPALFAADLETPLGKFAQKVLANRYLPNAVSFVNRDEELREAVSSLAERKENLLVAGSPGVGKTTFIRELESRLSQAFSDLGIPYGGIYELRKSALLADIQDSNLVASNFLDLLTNVIGAHSILLIEGIETLLGMGARARFGFLMEILDDFIDSHELMLIGTATPEGLDSCQMENADLISRFTAIHLSEPSHEMMLEILSAAKDVLEMQHALNIEDNALTAALDSSKRPQGLSLPARALELLDHICLSVRLSAERGRTIFIDASTVEEYIDHCSKY